MNLYWNLSRIQEVKTQAGQNFQNSSIFRENFENFRKSQISPKIPLKGVKTAKIQNISKFSVSLMYHHIFFVKTFDFYNNKKKNSIFFTRKSDGVGPPLIPMIVVIIFHLRNRIHATIS